MKNRMYRLVLIAAVTSAIFHRHAAVRFQDR